MADQPVGDTIKGITDDVRTLVQAEVELAKAELGPAAKHAGVGAGMFAGAGYFGINAASLGFVTVALILYQVAGLSLWLSFLIVTVALLLIAAILGLVGYQQVKKVKAPEKTIAQAKVSVAEVQAAIKRGMAAAKAPQIEGVVDRGDHQLTGATRMPKP